MGQVLARSCVCVYCRHGLMHAECTLYHQAAISSSRADSFSFFQTTATTFSLHETREESDIITSALNSRALRSPGRQMGEEFEG